MKRLTFYGASDDLLEVDGPGGDEWPADGSDGGRFKLAMPDGRGVGVGLQYVEGIWVVAVAPLMDDPDDPKQRMPAGWRLWLFQGGMPGTAVPLYSMGLIVECDDDAELTFEDDA